MDLDEEDDINNKDFKITGSRNAYIAQLNDKSVPRSVRNLQYTMNILILVFIILAIVEYSIVRSDLQTIGTNYEAV